MTEDIKLVINSFPDGLWRPFSECLNIPKNVDDQVMRYRSDFKYGNSKRIPKSFRGIAANVSYLNKKSKSTKSQSMLGKYEGGRGNKKYTIKNTKRTTRKMSNRKSKNK